MSAAPKPNNYTDAEDAAVIAMYRNLATVAVIAEAIGRSLESVGVRLNRLRAAGRLEARERSIGTGAPKSDGITWAPCIELRDDAKLVAACLAQGGIPRAVITKYGTAWAGPDGMPWRHLADGKPAKARRSSPMMAAA